MHWYIAILYRLLRIAGCLPLRWLHGAGAAFGWLVWYAHAAPRRRTQATLSLAVTLISDQTRHTLAKRSLIETGKSLFEVARVWRGDAPATLALVREVRGIERFDQALAAGRGVIIAAPHLGCWELLNFWFAAARRSPSSTGRRVWPRSSRCC